MQVYKKNFFQRYLKAFSTNFQKKADFGNAKLNVRDHPPV